MDSNAVSISIPSCGSTGTSARFLSPKQVQVGDEILESDKIFIDTGTRPAPPRIPGIDSVGYLTNESLMELQEIPEHSDRPRWRLYRS